MNAVLLSGKKKKNVLNQEPSQSGVFASQSTHFELSAIERELLP